LDRINPAEPVRVFTQGANATSDDETEMKTLLYKLFGYGKIPVTRLASLEREGIRIMDEGVAGSLIRINYRDTRGRRCSWCRRRLMSCSIALTRLRIIAYAGSGKVIDVPLTDPRISQMRFELEGDHALLVAFDVRLFHPDWSGTMEFRFHTPQAMRIVEELRPTLRPA
jgi:hypothetical protein